MFLLRTYKMELIGLRYFNVFGPRQDPNGAYAAVIPKFVNQLLNHQSPVINGDGNIQEILLLLKMWSRPICWPCLPKIRTH